MDNSIGFRLKSECLRAKTPTQEENLDLIRRIQAGDKTAASDFIVRNGKLVVRLISTNYPSYKDNEDVFQAGLMGLLKSAERFDFSYNVTMGTYAYNWITQSVGRYIADCESEIRIPVHTGNKLTKIRQAIRKYEADRESGDIKKYIIETTGFSVSDIDLLMPYVEKSTSLNSVVDTDDGSDSEVMDFIADSKDSIEKTVERQAVSEHVREILKEVLNEKEYAVIEYRFGFDSKVKSEAELRKITGITSRQGIQQCEARAIRKLRHPKYARLLRELN